MNPIIYVVATPIGNLKDITFRAIDTLLSVDLVVCEDTRVTKRLLQEYEIDKPTISYHLHSKLSKIDEIIAVLKEGKSIALVSDAGTPCISDPGSFLINKAREEIGEELKIIPIPGPSAITTALSATGFTDSSFLFLGFLPHKKGRETLFNEIAITERTVVFYESPHRFMKALESLQKVLQPKRKIGVARELTKMFEEIKIGTVSEIIDYYNQNKDKVRGEFVIMVAPMS
ncbi:MAG: Ribosomal RNA small subunit methyltransferase I [Parcubacteria group bacterium GW2011_GWF2_38_76]|nr:MAG: Ribosomal RNA small subunit methyltransferase I [Parcubacteria group bacterium GW2011_GWF2_38_76]HBM45840.1 16S rRNA (cytidine(1402)-2'-O)-methyltransferase [Patescibacteria group bacterium]